MQHGSHNFSRQDVLVYGRPAATVVAELTRQAGQGRVFIVTNRSLADSAIVREHQTALGGRCAGIFTGCAAHSPRDSVLRGSAAARAAGADVMVAIGGGSVIDAAKVMLACLWLGLETTAQLDALRDGAFATALKGPQALRLLAVPTTLSAAEFTPLAGITDPARQVKDLFLHPLFVPSAVVLDPAATLATPDWLFASTGVRSIDHCVETLLSAAPSPFGDAMARDGLRLLSRSLRAFAGQPAAGAGPLVGGLHDSLDRSLDRSLTCRLDCQLGTWLAISGPVAGVPLGASHAIGRVLGGAFGVPHGHTSCVLLPGVLRWNLLADQGRQQEVALAMDAPPGTSAADAVAALVRQLGQPATLRDLGIGRDSFPLIADKSMLMLAHPATAGNQRPVQSPQDVLDILELVY